MIISKAWYAAWNFSRDTNGNPTALYKVWVGGALAIAPTRRTQIGYSDTKHDAAEHALREEVRRRYFGQQVYLIRDPVTHPLGYKDDGESERKLNRDGYNRVNFLILDCPPEKFIGSEECNVRLAAGRVRQWLQENTNYMGTLPEGYARDELKREVERVVNELKEIVK